MLYSVFVFTRLSKCYMYFEIIERKKRDKGRKGRAYAVKPKVVAAQYSGGVGIIGR